MLYECTILDVDEEEVKIQIGNVQIVGFVGCGCEKNVGDICPVEIMLFDDLEITPSLCEESAITRRGNTYGYELTGVLDIDEHKLKLEIDKSILDFDIDREILFDYGYLDGRYVSVKVLRMDFDFA